MQKQGGPVALLVNVRGYKGVQVHSMEADGHQSRQPDRKGTYCARRRGTSPYAF